MAKYNEFGEQIPDQRPIELPLNYKAPETLQQTIQRMIQVESFRAGQNGLETEEEADDFDCDDEIEFTSQYEFTEMEIEHVPSSHVERKAEEKTAEKNEVAENEENLATANS